MRSLLGVLCTLGKTPYKEEWYNMRSPFCLKIAYVWNMKRVLVYNQEYSNITGEHLALPQARLWVIWPFSFPSANSISRFAPEPSKALSVLSPWVCLSFIYKSTLYIVLSTRVHSKRDCCSRHSSNTATRGSHVWLNSNTISSDLCIIYVNCLTC